MDKLIIKHLEFDTTSLDFASVKYFAETGQITGSLLLRLRAMLEEASGGKTSNDASALAIHSISNQRELLTAFCKFCEMIDETWALEFDSWIPQFLSRQ